MNINDIKDCIPTRLIMVDAKVSMNIMDLSDRRLIYLQKNDEE